MDDPKKTLLLHQALKECVDKQAGLRAYADVAIYPVAVFQNGRQLYEYMALSRGEAEAYRAFVTRKREHTKHYALELAPAYEARIQEALLGDVLADSGRREKLEARLKSLEPLDRETVERLPRDVGLLWSFDRDKTACIPANERQIYQEVYADRLPEGIDYGASAVVDETGRFGIIVNRTKPLGGKPDMAWVFPCRYRFARTDGGLAELHEEGADREDGLNRCMVADAWSGRVYSRSALAFSVGYFGEFIEVEGDGSLRQVRIDKEDDQIWRSDGYAYIVRAYWPTAVRSPKNGLWGYIDKRGREIIPCRYEAWGFFNDGYAIVKHNGRPMVIDESGNGVLAPVYRTIEHYKNGYFFVQNDEGEWALFDGGERVVDFVDVSQVKALPRRYDGFDDFGEINYQTVLVSRLRELAHQKQAKRYRLPLREYMALFGVPKSAGDLEMMGLWMHPVRVLKLPDSYASKIDLDAGGYIGWEYPSSSGMFDMREELPVVLSRRGDGASLVLGVAFEDLELIEPGEN